MPNRSAKILPLNVPIKPDIKIRYSTVEILNYKINNNLEITLQGAPDETAHIELRSTKKPNIIKIDDKKCKF